MEALRGLFDWGWEDAKDVIWGSDGWGTGDGGRTLPEQVIIGEGPAKPNYLPWIAAGVAAAVFLLSGRGNK